MSFLDSIGSFFSGGADKAALRAAEQSAKGYTQARGAIDAGETQSLEVLRDAYTPYAEGGREAFEQQSRLLGLRGPEEANEAFGAFRTSPGYQFSMDEGMRALDRSAASRGGLYSGSTGRSLTRFGQGLADQEFGNYYSRLAGLGSTGFAASSNLGTQSANTITGAADQRASALLGRQNALAGGTINAANARAQGLSNALSLAGKIAGQAMGGGFG